MKSSLRALMFKVWYGYISLIDKDADVLFMNYGYHDSEEQIKLDPEYEKNRYSIQLYHRLANAVDLKGKSIVEIGCGRGGGLAYITKRFSPSSALGIDLNKRAANFGNKHYKIEGLKFQEGNAMGLPLSDQSFDIVLNVESSHRYPDFDTFLSEVKRVLKPNGYFLFTDFRYSKDFQHMEEKLQEMGMSKIEGHRINKNVVEALNKDNGRRQLLVNKLMPKFLHKTALNFAGAVGSNTYNMIDDGRFDYFLYVFHNNNN